MKGKEKKISFICFRMANCDRLKPTFYKPVYYILFFLKSGNQLVLSEQKYGAATSIPGREKQKKHIGAENFAHTSESRDYHLKF